MAQVPSAERGSAASLSIDVDNQWSYMKIHGDAGWDAFPSYLDIAVPRVLALTDELRVRITCFVVGQDAALDKNRDALRSLADAGHEIGNHSFRHEPWMDRYSADEVDDELARAEAAIEAATGVVPTGFRGPGYCLSESMLRVLVERGYAYDASTLPTVVGPLARAYYFRTTRLSDTERAERAGLYGSWHDGLRPIAPYRWAIDGRTLLEMPLTTFPGLRIPVHMSYLLMLGRFSRASALRYLDLALRACAARHVEPSLLLHPLDVLSGTDVAHLDFFPGMQMPVDEKLAIVRGLLDLYTSRCEVMPVGEHARRLAAGDLPVRGMGVMQVAA